MSVQKFIVGMLLVVAVVAVWSLVDGAPWGTIVLRAIASAIVLQVGYFVVVLALIGREPGRSGARKAGKSSTESSEARSVASEREVSR
jgi:exopolysaccharide production repressor protein